MTPNVTEHRLDDAKLDDAKKVGAESAPTFRILFQRFTVPPLIYGCFGGGLVGTVLPFPIDR